MHPKPPFAELGEFLVVFQQVEASLVELIVQVTDADPEYVGALTAELEFNSKARALDVIYTRFSQIHGLSEQAPNAEFHELMGKVQKLATRRNDIVHSFYNTLVTVDAQVGLMRTPTRLKPSVGLRVQPHQDILPGQLQGEIDDVKKNILDKLELYRRAAIDTIYPVTG
jgi:hypothetical protein